MQIGGVADYLQDVEGGEDGSEGAHGVEDGDLELGVTAEGEAEGGR